MFLDVDDSPELTVKQWKRQDGTASAPPSRHSRVGYVYHGIGNGKRGPALALNDGDGEDPPVESPRPHSRGQDSGSSDPRPPRSRSRGKDITWQQGDGFVRVLRAAANFPLLSEGEEAAAYSESRVKAVKEVLGKINANHEDPKQMLEGTLIEVKAFQDIFESMVYMTVKDKVTIDGIEKRMWDFPECVDDARLLSFLTDCLPKYTENLTDGVLKTFTFICWRANEALRDLLEWTKTSEIKFAIEQLPSRLAFVELAAKVLRVMNVSKRSLRKMEVEAGFLSIRQGSWVALAQNSGSLLVQVQKEAKEDREEAYFKAVSRVFEAVLRICFEAYIFEERTRHPVPLQKEDVRDGKPDPDAEIELLIMTMMYRKVVPSIQLLRERQVYREPLLKILKDEPLGRVVPLLGKNIHNISQEMCQEKFKTTHESLSAEIQEIKKWTETATR